VDEWICEQCGGIYEAEDVALDCGFWDWIYRTRTDAALEAA
jgi:hypothetical protein